MAVLSHSYAQFGSTIKRPITSKNVFCVGENDVFTVFYEIEGCFVSGNQFIAQISDKNGSFSNATTVGQISSTITGNISCQIPTNLPNGENYKLRVISSNPEAISESVNIIYRPEVNNTLINTADNIDLNLNKTGLNTLIASNKLSSTARSTYEAGNSFLLSPGFEVNAGAVFETKFQQYCENQVRGFNQNWSFMPMFDNEVLSKIALLKPEMIRYPGGTVAHSWDWQIGQSDGQTNNIYHPPASVQVLYQKTNADIVFVLDILKKSLADQINMLQTFQNLGVPIKYIELGNEMYANDTAYSNVFATGANYAARVNQWYPVLKSNFPNAKIAALLFGREVSPNNARQYNWNADVVSTSTTIDAYTYHIYIGENTNFETVKANFTSVAANANTGNKELWITEYGNMHLDTEPDYFDELKKLKSFLENFPNVSIILNHLIFGNRFSKYLRTDLPITPEGAMFVEKVGGAN